MASGLIALAPRLGDDPTGSRLMAPTHPSARSRVLLAGAVARPRVAERWGWGAPGLTFSGLAPPGVMLNNQSAARKAASSPVSRSSPVMLVEALVSAQPAQIIGLRKRPTSAQTGGYGFDAKPNLSTRGP